MLDVVFLSDLQLLDKNGRYKEPEEIEMMSMVHPIIVEQE
jgi:hypothetical protein